MYIFSYCKEKNAKLKKERGISFEEIISLIENGKVIDIVKHPKVDRYPKQKFYILLIKDYIWLVLFVQEENNIFLKTAFPSRKHDKKYN